MEPATSLEKQQYTFVRTGYKDLDRDHGKSMVSVQYANLHFKKLAPLHLPPLPFGFIVDNRTLNDVYPLSLAYVSTG